MGFIFNRKPKKEISSPSQYNCKFSIRSSVRPAKEGYDQLNENEQHFFAAFESALVAEKLSPYDVKLTRLSSGTFNVDCSSGYIGKIQIPSKPNASFYIQYFGPRGGIKEMNTQALDQCIDVIPALIQTIKRLNNSRRRATR